MGHPAVDEFRGGSPNLSVIVAEAPTEDRDRVVQPEVNGPDLYTPSGIEQPEGGNDIAWPLIHNVRQVFHHLLPPLDRPETSQYLLQPQQRPLGVERAGREPRAELAQLAPRGGVRGIRRDLRLEFRRAPFPELPAAAPAAPEERASPSEQRPAHEVNGSLRRSAGAVEKKSRIRSGSPASGMPPASRATSGGL